MFAAAAAASHPACPAPATNTSYVENMFLLLVSRGTHVHLEIEFR
jgi:hypothetical protein